MFIFHTWHENPMNYELSIKCNIILGGVTYMNDGSTAPHDLLADCIIHTWGNVSNCIT